jgi:hypothetical protein
VQLIESVGGTVYVVGTRRPRGSRCRKCGEFVTEHQGTCQTAGIPDLLAFLPPRPQAEFVFIEAKAVDGRLSTPQREFRDLCLGARLAHVVGGLDAVIAFLLERGRLLANNVPHYRLPKDPTP